MTIKSIKPYPKVTSKKEQIQEMFNNISKKYDVANTTLSFGIHHYWRNKVVEKLKPYQPELILDLATGTADLSIALSALHPQKIIAADFADNMLKIAHQKILQKKLTPLIDIKKEDGENLSFEDNTFDAITIAFGIRNFEDYSKGLQEIYRTLKPGGVLMILEFTTPKNKIIKVVYNFYFKFILPIIAWLITRDKKAYDYLPSSVKAFPQYEEFCNIILTHQFKECQFIPLTGGIATIYIARK